jgi:hypothetical protein
MSITPITDRVYDVCMWPVDPACFTEEWNTLSEEIKTRSLAMASATLHRLTGYRVGGCPVTVRPCKSSCAADYGSFGLGGFTPHIDLQGTWVNTPCGCDDSCNCGPLCEVELPLPIYEIEQVLIDGVDYTLDTKVINNHLVWTGAGDCPFPTCQNLAAAPGQPGAFSVTYHQTARVDATGAYAAALLAMEFAKACTGSTKCRLPSNVTNVTRQGVSMQLVTGAFPDGWTSIREVDTFIALWRPEGSPRWAPKVWTPRSGTRVER